jgi:hypothetical protein
MRVNLPGIACAAVALDAAANLGRLGHDRFKSAPPEA